MLGMEAIKYGPVGHVVFDLTRRCGYSINTALVRGACNPRMLEAVRSGRCLDLRLTSTSWTVDEAAALALALRAPGSRVRKFQAAGVGGDGATAACAAAVAVLPQLELAGCVGRFLGALPLPSHPLPVWWRVCV